MKHYLLFITLFFSCYIQSQNNGTERCFAIGKLIFCPDSKTILSLSVGDFNSVLEVDTLDIDYDNATLYICGNKLFLNKPVIPRYNSERDTFDLAYDTIDLKDLHVYSVLNDTEYDVGIMQVYDDKRFYTIFGDEIGMISEEIITEWPDSYDWLSPFLIRDHSNNRIRAFVDNNFFIDLPSDTKIDMPSFKYLAAVSASHNTAFYTDKNGLYIYSYFANLTLGKIADSGGRKIDPIVRARYIIYDNKLFSRSFLLREDYSVYSELNLDFDNLRIFDRVMKYPLNPTILTDGKTAYLGGAISFEEDDRFKIVQQLISKEDISFFTSESDSENLYFSLNFNQENNKCETVLRTDSGYMAIKREDWSYKTETYKNLYIFNHQSKQYELFDFTQYQYLTDGFFVYKEVLYNTFCEPLKDMGDVNTKKLQRFVYNDIKTDFITDGKNLICKVLDEQYGYEIPPKKRAISSKKADIKSLRAISPTLLVDKNNFYAYSFWGALTVIPIKELGIPVITIPINNN